MKCFFCKQIKEIKKTGSCEGFVAALKSSYVILGQGQYFKGYCLIFMKNHKEQLGQLPGKKQKALYADVIRVAGAIDRAFKPARINYENLGNITHHIHWHIIPRYKSDPYKKLPIWQIPEEKRKGKLTKSQLEDVKKKLKSFM